MTKAKEDSKDSYHHGELPEVLMQLALKHIELDGTERLSLRALAREAGVSQTAPYRHFPTKNCLLAAIATKGFLELKKRIQLIVESEDSIDERFMSMGVAYVEYALENPTAYHLMFGAVLADFSEYQTLEEAATAAYAQVRRCELELIETNQLEVHSTRFGGVIWAGVHGIASLLLMGHRRSGINDTGQAIAAMRADIEGSLQILFGHFVQHPRKDRE